MNDVAEAARAVQETASSMNIILNYITHPILIWDWLIGIIYWVAVIISCTCVLFHVVTQARKPLQIGAATILAYILIKSLDLVVR